MDNKESVAQEGSVATMGNSSLAPTGETGQTMGAETLTGSPRSYCSTS